MWKCPKCGRTFKKNNQSHSCNTYTEEEHFENLSEFVKELYISLIKIIEKKIGNFSIDPVHCCIHLVNPNTFVAIKPQKSSLKIFFLSQESIQSNRIIKQERYSSKRINNTLKIHSKDDIDEELIEWFITAYHLTL